MKINILPLCLILLILTGRCLAGSNIDVIVVAEQSLQGAKLAPPTPERPVSFVVCNGDYIEARIATGGDKPPAPAAVGQQLQQVLQSRNYQLTPAQPSILLIYHWGIVQDDEYRIRLENTTSGANGLGIVDGPLAKTSTFYARLSLVTPDEQFDNIAERIQHPRTGFHELGKLVPKSAADSRYFVVIAAYNYADLSHGVATLLWRVKASAEEHSGLMSEVLPALIQSCGPYLGGNFDIPQNLSVPLPLPLPRTIPAERSPAVAPEYTGSVLIRTLIQREHAFYSGESYISDRKQPPVLPPTIAKHIAAYQREKAALENLLTERIKARSSAQDIRAAVNVFKEEQAPLIDALAKQREELRDELARFCAAKSPGITDATLDSLLKEFASEKLHLAPSSTTPH